MTDFIEYTAKGRYYKVYKDTVYVSQHTTEREAAQVCANLLLSDPESSVRYVHEYEVEVGLTDAGITEAQNYTPAVDQPPTIDSTPDPSSFVDGQASTYDFSTHVTDNGVSALTYALSPSIPNGLALDSATGILSLDGVTRNQGHDTPFTLTVSNDTYSVDSSPFNIVIQATSSATIVVQANGLGPGAITTIQQGINAASAGDIIEVRSNTAGTTTYFNEALTFPTNGTNGNEITLRGRAGDTIVLYSTVHIMTLVNNSYWQFKNLQLGRDQTLNGWSYTTGRANVEHSSWCNADGGVNHHILFEDCRMYGGGSWYHNVHNDSTQTDHHFGFIRCTVTHAGSPTGVSLQEGNGLSLAGYSHLIKDCNGKDCGHDILGLSSNYTVLRGGIYNGSMEEHQSNYGNRCLSFDPDKGLSPYGYCLMDGVVVKDTKVDGSNALDPGAKIGAYNMICRRNYFIENRDTSGYGLSYTSSPIRSGGAAAGDYWRLYNNTSYRDGGLGKTTDINLGTENNDHFIESRFKNNIWAEMGNGNSNLQDEHFRWIRSNSTASGYSDDWRGAEFENNILHRTADADIKVIFAGTGGATKTGLTAVQAQWPSVWFDNSSTAPAFSNVNNRMVDDIDTVTAAFQLNAGSAGKDAAVALTQTSSSGSGTTLTVDDARYFYCGADPLTWDLSYFGEVGDYIKIGSTNPVQINAIDYDTNVITLAASRTWNDNDEVFLVDADGVTVVDDMGASQ